MALMPSECRACGECDGRHHFSEMYLDAEDCTEDGPDVACKHCPAIADHCSGCDGEGCGECDETGVCRVRTPEDTD